MSNYIPEKSSDFGLSSFELRPESLDFVKNPYPDFAFLQDHDPIHWSPRLKAWVLTRYAQVREVAQNPEMSSNRLRPFFANMPGEEAQRISQIIRYLSLWMVFNDAPDHARLRRLITQVFNAKRMIGMQADIQHIIDYLIDSLDGHREFDLIKDFASPLPALVIMRLLGVRESYLPLVKKRSDEMALFIGSSRGTPEKYTIAEKATQEMAQFFKDIICERRSKPETDLISELIAIDQGGDKLNDDELVATCILLLFAGHETTTNHIGNGMLSLLKFPHERAKLQTNPALAERAVEELLRYDGPSGAQVRIVSQDGHLSTELGTHQLEAGQRVFLMLNAANRDPRAYADPDQLQIGRKGPPHLTFGAGKHVCLGFPLARLEGRLAFNALLSRFPLMELIDHEPPWIHSLVFRGVERLLVKV
jgi:cytochrome P450